MQCNRSVRKPRSCCGCNRIKICFNSRNVRFSSQTKDWLGFYENPARLWLCRLLSCAAFMNKPLCIIIDTDVGDDIDDALALAVALRSPEVRVVGVTTVFRDGPRRALLSREVLNLFGGQQVPVFAGCSEPMLPQWDSFPGGRGLGRQFEALDPGLKWDDRRHAVDFLIQTAREFIERGEELTFVPIGALTNIAIALRLAPDIAPHIKIRAMGALWSRPQWEWNILCDPEAAAMVLSSGADLTFVSFDVTEQCVLSGEQEAQFAGSAHAGARFLGELIPLWGHKITLHDPLTILTLFSDLVSFETMRLEVVLNGDNRGVTQRVEGVPNARVSTQVEVEKAKNLFLERILKAS